jgi:hypothetical protein
MERMVVVVAVVVVVVVVMSAGWQRSLQHTQERHRTRRHSGDQRVFLFFLRIF